MSTYQSLAQYVQFKTPELMDEEVTKFKQVIGYDLNKTDNDVLDYIRRHAVRYTGVFYQLVETIATNVNKSVSTVKRVLAKLVKHGILKRIPTIRKKSGGKGATIFQFQMFKNEPLQMSHCNEKKSTSIPCESKDDKKQVENKPCYSINKDLKDLKTYQQADDVPVSKDIENLSKTPYQVMKDLLHTAIDDKKIISRIYGIWKAQIKRMKNKPTTDLLIQAVKTLITEMKIRASKGMQLYSPTGYFNGIITNLIDKWVEMKSEVAYETVIEMHEEKGINLFDSENEERLPEYFYW